MKKSVVKPVRIALTGIGLVTPLGTTRETSWQALLAGARAGRWLTPENIPTPLRSAVPFGRGTFAAPVDWRELEGVETALPATSQFAVTAAEEAVRHANLSRELLAGSACVIGTSKPDLQSIDQYFEAVSDQAERDIATQFTELFPSQPSTVVAQHFGMQGAAICPVAACATGLLSLIQGAQLIRHGVTSCVLAGGTDASIHPGLIGSYQRLGVMARPGDDPAAACRPFDRTRSGFLVGEGAAVIVMEEWEAAQRRGAKPLAEWIDGAVSSDPSGMTLVDETGNELSVLLERLLRRNSIDPFEVSSVCYHGTATHLNDLSESRAIDRVFGKRQLSPLGFALKGSLGHLMGAAGAVEMAFSLLSLRDRLVPPTANLAEQDPDCEVRLTLALPEPVSPGLMLKTSLGFGGHLAASLLKPI